MLKSASPTPVAFVSNDMRRRWLILALLSIGVMISFIDRTSISAALTSATFRRDFALSDLQRGWVNSAFFWLYAVLQIPFGIVVDRYGVKWPYAICFALWCVATATIGLTSSLIELFGLRLIIGAAEAVVVPATWRWIRTKFAESQSGMAVGIFMLGSKIGPAVGTPLAALLIVQLGWRVMFLTIGGLGMLWLVPWLLAVKDDTRPQENSFVNAVSPTSPPLSIRRLLANQLIWATLVVNFCYSYFVFYCMTWMPAYLVEQRGLSLTRMGFITFTSFAGIGIVAILGGWAADRFIKRGFDAAAVRKAFTIVGFILASTVVLGTDSPSLNVALFWNVASLMGLGLATANHLAVCRLTLIPASSVGIVTGMQQVAAAFAGVVAPLLTGWLLHASGSYDAAIEAIFIFLILGALTTAFGLRRDWSRALVN